MGVKEESHPTLGHAFPCVQGGPGGRSTPLPREKHVVFTGGSGGSSHPRACRECSTHVTARLLHPLWVLGARPLRGASSDAFFPSWGHQPHILSLQAGVPSVGTPQLCALAGRATGDWGTSPQGCHGCPQDSVTTPLCIGTNLWWDRCHRQG